MSEFDSGSGRKGFVHDVMRRISSSAPRGGDSPDDDRERGGSRYQEELEDLRDAIRLFGTDSDEFRRRLGEILDRSKLLETPELLDHELHVGHGRDVFRHSFFSDDYPTLRHARERGPALGANAHDINDCAAF